MPATFITQYLITSSPSYGASGSFATILNTVTPAAARDVGIADLEQVSIKPVNKGQMFNFC
jgi:hypothetical protein